MALAATHPLRLPVQLLNPQPAPVALVAHGVANRVLRLALGDGQEVEAAEFGRTVRLFTPPRGAARPRLEFRAAEPDLDNRLPVYLQFLITLCPCEIYEEGPEVVRTAPSLI